MTLSIETAASETAAILALQRVNNLLPDRQDLATVEPTTTVRTAVSIMQKHNYSNLPIVHDGRVLGVFSYRSLVVGLARHSATSLSFDDLQVAEFAERIPFARVDDEIDDILRDLERYDLVLVGEPKQLQALATPMDLLLHLYRIASPFVLVQVIELALRELIRASVDDRQFADCVQRSLTKLHGSALPNSLDGLTLAEYVDLVTNGDNWPLFAPWAGGNRRMTRTRLRPVVDLRNDIMHFRRELTAEDYDTLTEVKEWLLSKLYQTGRLGARSNPDY